MLNFAMSHGERQRETLLTSKLIRKVYGEGICKTKGQNPQLEYSKLYSHTVMLRYMILSCVWKLLATFLKRMMIMWCDGQEQLINLVQVMSWYDPNSWTWWNYATSFSSRLSRSDLGLTLSQVFRSCVQCTHFVSSDMTSIYKFCVTRRIMQ